MSLLFFCGTLFFVVMFLIASWNFLFFRDEYENNWRFFEMVISITLAILCLILSYGFSTATGTIVDINPTDNSFIIQDEEKQKIRVFVEDWEVGCHKKGEKYVFRRFDIG